MRAPRLALVGLAFVVSACATTETPRTVEPERPAPRVVTPPPPAPEPPRPSAREIEPFA